MARRADHTREELTELAIRGGIQLIKKEGFSSFSARKLATHIGYTVGTLYNVFGSYDAMILHINAHSLDEWHEKMTKALEKNKGNKALHTLARAYIGYSRTHYQQWIALFEYHLSEGYVLPEWYIAKIRRLFLLVEEVLLPLMDGNHRKAKHAAHLLWASIHGICVLSLSGKFDLVKADSPEALTSSLIDTYLAGLA